MKKILKTLIILIPLSVYCIVMSLGILLIQIFNISIMNITIFSVVGGLLMYFTMYKLEKRIENVIVRKYSDPKLLKKALDSEPKSYKDSPYISIPRPKYVEYKSYDGFDENSFSDGYEYFVNKSWLKDCEGFNSEN